MPPTNPYETYQRQRTVGWTRIDLLLALYDGAIERLEQAGDALARKDDSAAAPLLLRAQRIVVELIAGLDLRYGEIPRNLQQLYAFVLHAIAVRSERQIGDALIVMRTLRDGLVEIRSEALSLERSGAVAPTDLQHALQAIA